MYIEGNLSRVGQGIIPELVIPPTISCDLIALNASINLVTNNLNKIKPLTDDLVSQALRDVIEGYARHTHQPGTALSMLVQYPEYFYELYFPHIKKGLLREKRWLHFETPNRLNVTHEYVVDTKIFPRDLDFIYLFSPRSRLAWLRVEINGQRVEILPSGQVKQQLKKILEPEISQLLKTTHKAFLKVGFTVKKEFLNQEILRLLYTMPGTLPAFIFFSKDSISNRPEVVITAQYFDAFHPLKRSVIRTFLSGMQLWEERKLRYILNPKSPNSTFWLYVKAPSGFHISCSTLIKTTSINANNPAIDLGPVSDPEIASIWLEQAANKRNSLQLKTQADDLFETSNEMPISITISLPKTLKLWLGLIFFVSLSTIVWVLITLLDKVNIATIIGNSSFALTNDYLVNHTNQGSLLSAILAILAFIVTARGWLIHEETVMAPLTRWYTILSASLLILLIAVVLLIP